MRFPLTQKLLDEASRYGLRSACSDCVYQVRSSGRCGHEWPNEPQRRWPLSAPNADGSPATSVDFCREFELK